MERKTELNKYLNNLYEFYKNNNYKYFVEKCLNYNIKIGDYNKNIDKLSKNVFNLILESVDKSTTTLKYSDNNHFYNISVFDENKINYNMPIIIDIPVFEDNYERISMNIFNYFISCSCNFSMRFYKILKNDYLKVILYNIDETKKFINYFNSNSELMSEIKSRVLPFIYSDNLLGIYTEISPYSFKNFYIKYLYLFFSSINFEVDESFDLLHEFYKYIYNKYKNEININKKRMFLLVFKYLNIYINDLTIYSIFDLNFNVDITSYDSNSYSLRVENKNNIFFKGNFDEVNIRYGTLDFLGISFSKYYERIIKMNSLNEIYSKFYIIYNDLLSSNFKNIGYILSLIDDDMDFITKQLTIFSSAYYAYIMFSFSLKDIYIILDKVLNLIDIHYNNYINNDLNKINYILEDKYANLNISLKNNTKMSIKNYFDKFNVLSVIDCNSIIHLKDGSSLKGDIFINELYKYIENYNDFNELFNDMVLFIEY